MKKRKAQLVYIPPPKRDKTEGTHYTVEGAIQRGVDFEVAAEAGAKSKYRGLWCFDKPWEGPPRWTVPVDTPKGVPPPPVHWVRGPTPGFKGREPYFIARNVRSEVEAALLRDVATLWLKLHETGCTRAELQAVKWNLPCMEKDEKGVVKPLQRVAPADRAAARKALRHMTNRLLPALPKRLVPDYTVRRLQEQRERKAAEKKRHDEDEADVRRAAKARLKADEEAQRAAQAKAAEAARLKAAAKRKREAAAATARAAREQKAAAAAVSKARAARAAAWAGKRG